MASSDRRRLPLLPHELLLGIVDRIPIGQLKVLRLLNKEWYKYLTQRLQPYTSEVFLRTNPEDQTVVEIFKRDIINQEVAHSRFPLEIPPELPGPVESIIDCDGLLLCKCKNLEPGRSEYPHLAIWNPVLKSARLIDPMDGSKALFNYGFGYELTSPLNYKILRIPRWTPPTPSYPVRGRPVEIYSFRTQTWKPHTADCDNWPEPIPKNIGLCVKGTMYWWFEKIALVSFDFSRERFKRHFGPCSLDMYKPVLGSFPGGKLSLLGAEHYHDSDLHVWVSNELGCDNVVAFAKYFTLPCNQIISMFGLDYFRSLPIKVVRPAFSFVDNTVKSVIVAAENADNIFIEDSDRLFIFYKIDELGVITPCEIGRGDYSTDPVAYVYFPSRVPLPSPSPQLVTLPELLPYNALEPVFSAETLQTHFQLHKDYVITHNNALDNLYRAVLMEDRSAETTKWQSIIDFNAAGMSSHFVYLVFISIG